MSSKFLDNFRFMWGVKACLELPPNADKKIIKQEVNLSLMASKSGLFNRKLIEVDNEKAKKQLSDEVKKANGNTTVKIGEKKEPFDEKKLSLEISFANDKFIFPEKIQHFLALCNDINIKMDIPLAIELIFVAEEWEAPTVVEKVKGKLFQMFKDKKYSVFQIFDELLNFYKFNYEQGLSKLPIQNRESKKNIGKAVVDYTAEHFKDYLMNFGLDYQEEFLSRVLESPYFARPPRALFDSFIVTFVSLNVKKYIDYLNMLDPFRSDLSILESAIKLIQKKGYVRQFSILIDVYKMRVQIEEQEQNMNEALILKDQIYKLKTFNNELNKKINETNDEISKNKKP